VAQAAYPYELATLVFDPPEQHQCFEARRQGPLVHVSRFAILRRRLVRLLDCLACTDHIPARASESKYGALGLRVVCETKAGRNPRRGHARVVSAKTVKKRNGMETH